MLLCLPPFFWLVKKRYFHHSKQLTKRGSPWRQQQLMLYDARDTNRGTYFSQHPKFTAISSTSVLLYLQNAYFKHTLTFPHPLVSFLLLFVFRFGQLLLHLSCIQSTLHQIVSTLVHSMFRFVRNFLEGGNVATNVDSL